MLIKHISEGGPIAAIDAIQTGDEVIGIAGRRNAHIQDVTGRDATMFLLLRFAMIWVPALALFYHAMGIGAFDGDIGVRRSPGFIAAVLVWYAANLITLLSTGGSRGLADSVCGTRVNLRTECLLTGQRKAFALCSVGLLAILVWIGVPSSIAQLFMALGVIFLTRVVATFGPDGIAAFGIGYRLDMLAFLPALGITLATVTLVGHNVGAHKHFRALKAAIHGCVLISIEAGIIGLLYFLFPEFFISLLLSLARDAQGGNGTGLQSLFGDLLTAGFTDSKGPFFKPF